MKQQRIRLAPTRTKKMGLRWAALRKPAVPPRNDHIHLFSSEANARRLRAAMRDAEEGRLRRFDAEELGARYALGRF